MIKLTTQQKERLDRLLVQLSTVAQDDKWITIHPNGKENKGQPMKISDDGRVLAGAGGKFNGQKISEIRKSFVGAKTPTRDKETTEYLAKLVSNVERNAGKHIKNGDVSQMKSFSDTIGRISKSRINTANDKPTQDKLIEIKKKVDAEIEKLSSESEKKKSTSKRLERLEQSLANKQDKVDSMIQNHFDTVKQANGQPLNDKRNGAATLKKWDKQASAINKQMAEVEKTERAIEREKSIIEKVSSTKLPSAINEAIQSGEITQWRKYPNRFFVKGVEKGRIIWDEKKGQLLNSYYSQIPDEQKPVFKEAYFKLKAKLEGKSSEAVQKENEAAIQAKADKKAADEAKKKSLHERIDSLFKKSMNENASALKAASENQSLSDNVRKGYKEASEKVEENLSKLSNLKNDSVSLKENNQEKVERGLEFTEAPKIPDWYADIRSKHSSPFWNGKYYDGKKAGTHRIYVSGKEYTITDAQKKELEQHRKDYSDYVAAQKATATYLNVPYEQRELAKKHGAKWDADKKKWYLPKGTELAKEIEHFSPNYVKPEVVSEKEPAQKIDQKSNDTEKRYFGARLNLDVSKMSLSEVKEYIKELDKGRRTYNNIMNEGGEGFNPFDNEPAYERAHDRIKQIQSEEFAKEWTKEKTNERRSMWNSEGAKLPRTPNGMVKISDINALEKRLGFTVEDIKKAKLLHGIE